MNGRGTKPKKPLPHCPSCGMDSGRRMEDEKGQCYVVCESCGAIVGPYANSSAATKGWQKGKVKYIDRKSIPAVR